ncbi:MAG: hypothetical protein L6R39_003519 [Caloplaca ligustica]|nr:MAG: hypothetical protein L6R39_003519 [Caloplaca ligustica]
MVYVAYGALVLCLPIVIYTYSRYKRVQSKGGRHISPPQINVVESRLDGNEKPTRNAQDDLSDLQPVSVVHETESNHASKGTLGDTKSKRSSQNRTTSDATPRIRGDQARHPATQDNMPTEKSSVAVSKATMQPPARPGPRLRSKAKKDLTPPSAPQPSNNSLRVPPTLSSTLRPPPSIASTLRAPPNRSLGAPSSSAPTASTLPSSQRPSKKVQLEPGHSPLDWANLISKPPSSTYLRGDDVSPSLIRVPPSLLRYHNGRKGKNAWGVWQGKVYNLTPYMKFHPGGVNELMKGAGREKDAERLFMEVHPWVNWEGLLGECLVGILVSEDETTGSRKGGGDGLEDMD